MTLLTGYVPFIEPMNALQPVWFLLIVPLAIGISMIYKAMRLTRLERFWGQVVLMTVQIILATAGLAVALAVFVQVVIPLL